MRLPGIIERSFFPNEPVLTFPSAPGTHYLHGNLALLI